MVDIVNKATGQTGQILKKPERGGATVCNLSDGTVVMIDYEIFQKYWRIKQ